MAINQSSKIRILTGIQSTGIPHLGNILGSIVPAIALSRRSKTPACFFIADLHALTTQRDPHQLKKFTYATAAAWIACGLDTEQHILYRQSHVPQVCELSWYLNCVTPYPMLANAHAFKDKSAHLADVTAGLFTYPVLMAADILLYRATHVPVGKDQKQHLEMARDIARTFNHQYNNVFTLPQPHITRAGTVVPGSDGRKMSKSYNNTINIFAEEKVLSETIMHIATGSEPLSAPKSPDTCTVFSLYRLLASPSEVEQMRKRYLKGGYGYQSAKKALLALILDTFSAERKRFTYYMQSPQLLEQKLAAGEAKAKVIADDVLAAVRAAIGVHSS